MFVNWRALAKKYNKTIVLYYGVSGCGKGLVDSVSSFGVKGPFPKSIITEIFFQSCRTGERAFRAETP